MRVLLVVRVSGRAVSLTCLEVSSMGDEVVGVFAFSPPGQVRHTVVCGDTVEMSNLLPIRSTTQKCFGHELVNPSLFVDAISTHVDRGMTIRANLLFEDPATVLRSPAVTPWQASHTPKIRDLVQALVLHDRQPVFGRLTHIDSSQSVMPRAVRAAAGPLHTCYGVL